MSRWLTMWALFITGGAIYGIGQHEGMGWVTVLGAAAQAVAFALAVGMPPIPGSDFE